MSLHPIFAGIMSAHFPALPKPVKHPCWTGDTHDCEAEGSFSACDDSYDDAFGTVRIAPYLICNVCNKSHSMPEREL
jgi:hypothetical protein